MFRPPFGIVVGCLLFVLGCASLVAPQPLTRGGSRACPGKCVNPGEGPLFEERGENPLQAHNESLERQCARFFNALDQAVASAGIADGEAAIIPGFPYLRVDRMLASMGSEAMSVPVFEAWVDRLQDLAEGGRRMEIANLAKAQQLRLRGLIPQQLRSQSGLDAAVEICGERLRAVDLRDESGRT